MKFKQFFNDWEGAVVILIGLIWFVRDFVKYNDPFGWGLSFMAIGSLIVLGKSSFRKNKN